jgi:hypothetical protein
MYIADQGLKNCSNHRQILVFLDKKKGRGLRILFAMGWALGSKKIIIKTF